MSTKASAVERKVPLAGDAFVREAAGEVMHAVTIAAPPAAVWPWLVQMGSGRAGWYSYDWIDNDGEPSAERIVAELQHLGVGDIMPSLRGATDSFIVATMTPARDLVLTVPAADGSTLASWEFFLEPIEARGTRLMVRGCFSALWPGGGGKMLSPTPRWIERVYWLLARIPRWLMVPGEASATFNRDGSFGGMLTNARRRVTMQFPAGRSGRDPPRMTAETFISLAKSAGLWRATEETGKLEFCSTTTTGLGNMTMSGVGATRTRPIPFGPSAYIALNYSCAGNAMTITVPGRGAMPSFSVQMERTGPAPPPPPPR